MKPASKLTSTVYVSLVILSFLLPFSSAVAAMSPRPSNAERARRNAAGRVSLVANRILLTMYFGKAAVLPMQGVCDPAYTLPLFKDIKTPDELLRRHQALTGTSNAFICKPIRSILNDHNITIHVPKIIDTHILLSWLLSARSDRNLIAKLAVPNVKDTVYHIAVVPLGPEIDEAKAIASIVDQDLTRLGDPVSSEDHGQFVSVEFPFR